MVGEDQTGLPVYRALRPLLCRDCGDPIAEGALFTRWPLAEDGLRILPRCRKCVPLEFTQDGARQPSELIKALLAKPPEEKSSTTVRRQKERIDEEISKRLSPALLRARRPRGQ